MKNNQHGFNAVAVVLIIVIVGILSVAGWVAFNSQRQTKKALDNANSALSDIAKEKAETNSDAPSPLPPKDEKYLEIKELGVKFKISPGLNGIYYVVRVSGGTHAYFSLDSLKRTDCAADKTAQVALTKYTQAELDKDPNKETVMKSAKKINDAYYVVVGGQAACSQDAAILEKASAMRRAVVDSVTESLQAIE